MNTVQRLLAATLGLALAFALAGCGEPKTGAWAGKSNVTFKSGTNMYATGGDGFSSCGTLKQDAGALPDKWAASKPIGTKDQAHANYVHVPLSDLGVNPQSLNPPCTKHDTWIWVKYNPGDQK